MPDCGSRIPHSYPAAVGLVSHSVPMNEIYIQCSAGRPAPGRKLAALVRWRDTVTAVGRPDLRVHDLRHTAASLWLSSGADPKVVQRVLGHASGAMTMDRYGHLIDQNLWGAAEQIGRNGGISGARSKESTPKSDHTIPSQTASD